jgi:hypothetical protein
MESLSREGLEMMDRPCVCTGTRAEKGNVFPSHSHHATSYLSIARLAAGTATARPLIASFLCVHTYCTPHTSMAADMNPGWFGIAHS